MRRFGPILLLASAAVFSSGSGAREGRARNAVPRFLGEARPKGVPRRVVTLAPNLTEILFALGLGDRVVGVTNYDDYPPQVATIPKVGGFVDPSVEAILALEPQLVLCVPNSGGRNRMEALSRMKVPVLIEPAYGLDDIFTAITHLGDLFGKKERAKELVGQMRSRIRNVTERVAGLRRPRTLLVYGHKPLMAAGKDSFGDAMLRIAGGKNVLGQSAVRYPSVPMEEIIRLAPEVIIDASASGQGAEMSREEVETVWGRWKVVPAVQSGRIHIFDSALWFRPGPRVVEGLEQLAALLHPPKS